MVKNIFFIICFAFSLMACDPHRIDIQQGNKIKPETLSKLKLGMNRKQVIYLLGTPLLKDPFHQDRWDYIYYLKPGNKEVRQSRVTLHFKDGKLITIDDSSYAPDMHGDKANTENIDVNDPPPTLNTNQYQ